MSSTSGNSSAPETITEEWARHLLQKEDADARFEEFCCDLFSAIDGVQYFTTARSWDLGRDARTGKPRELHVICASCRRDTIKKGEEDAARLKETTSPIAVRFCSPRDLSEYEVETIEGLFSRAFPESSVHKPETERSLSKYAIRHPEIVQKHYGGELEILRRNLRAESPEDSRTEFAALRTALSIQIGEDAESLRRELLVNVVLAVLQANGDARADELASAISKRLGLARTVGPTYLLATLQRIVERRLATCDLTGAYRISGPGKDLLGEQAAAAVSREFEGRNLLCDAIQQKTGCQIGAKQRSRLWNATQESIAAIFLTYGLEIVDAVQRLSDGSCAEAGEVPEFEKHIGGLAAKIGALPGWGAQGPDVKQALLDVFFDRQTPAFRWLTGLCLSYVAMCALGLDQAAQSKIKNRLKSIDLLLDTDIALSWYCEGESNHGAVDAMVRSWIRLGGSVRVEVPVLEELGYHAWIAEYDFLGAYDVLPSVTAEKSHTLIGNAFVRAFWTRSKRSLSRPAWLEYRATFRGHDDKDFSLLAETLRAEGLQTPAEVVESPDLVRRVADALVAENFGGQYDQYSATAEDKARRDGRHVECLRRLRKDSESEGRKAVIVSSSRLLSKVIPRFSGEVGGLPAVVPVAAILFMLELVPESNLTLESLRTSLFDLGQGQALRPLERLTLRVIEASEQYSIPTARRGALMAQVTRKVLERAAEQGVPAREVERQMLHAYSNKEATESAARLIAAAVDQIASAEAAKEHNKR